MKVAIGFLYGTLALGLTVVAISLSGCGKDDKDFPFPVVVTVTHKNVVVEIATMSDVAEVEKAKVETALKTIK